MGVVRPSGSIFWKLLEQLPISGGDAALLLEVRVLT